MLEENLQFHKAMGVDGFIITDNNSTDSTPDIIRKYKQKGWIKEVIEEKATCPHCGQDAPREAKFCPNCGGLMEIES